jgi:membrane protein implicated in regulation of membrane protease activity
MEGKDAVWLLVLICMLLAVMALAGKIEPKIAGGAFAAALAILGVLSRGFRKRSHKPLHS